jgi:hypothetical protein
MRSSLQATAQLIHEIRHAPKMKEDFVMAGADFFGQTN